MSTPAFIFTLTAVSLFVLASAAVQQLFNTWTNDYEKRKAWVDSLDSLGQN